MSNDNNRNVAPDLTIDQVPTDILVKAREVEMWFRQRNCERWELGGTCSRNHAQELKAVADWAEEQTKLLKIMRENLEKLGDPNR